MRLRASFIEWARLRGHSILSARLYHVWRLIHAWLAIYARLATGARLSFA